MGESKLEAKGRALCSGIFGLAAVIFSLAAGFASERALRHEGPEQVREVLLQRYRDEAYAERKRVKWASIRATGRRPVELPGVPDRIELTSFDPQSSFLGFVFRRRYRPVTVEVVYVDPIRGDEKRESFEFTGGMGYWSLESD